MTQKATYTNYLTDSIVHVLSLIGYAEDMNKYAEEFIQFCEKQAMLDVLQALPKERQEILKQQLEGVKDQEQQKEILAQYIPLDQYQAAVQQASQTAFQELLEEIIPTLSSHQTEKLQLYLHSLKLS